MEIFYIVLYVHFAIAVASFVVVLLEQLLTFKYLTFNHVAEAVGVSILPVVNVFLLILTVCAFIDESGILDTTIIDWREK